MVSNRLRNVCLHLEAKQYTKITLQAEREGVSRNKLIREAVDMLLEERRQNDKLYSQNILHSDLG